MQADDPEYTESSAGEYLRSYDTEDDALGHQSSGFLWTGAQAAAKSVVDFGEFQQFLTKPAGATWQNLYCDATSMAATGQPTAYPWCPHRRFRRSTTCRCPASRSSTPRSRTSTVPDLEAELREERGGQPEHVLAVQ